MTDSTSKNIDVADAAYPTSVKTFSPLQLPLICELCLSQLYDIGLQSESGSIWEYASNQIKDQSCPDSVDESSKFCNAEEYHSNAGFYAACEANVGESCEPGVLSEKMSA